MGAGFTQGPWRLDRSPMRNALCVMSDNAWICGEIDNDQGDMAIGEALANANLIAAAPELYEAVELALQLVETDHVDLWRTVPDRLRAALARARGDQ